MRQGASTEFDPPRGVAIATLAYDYRPGHRVADHAHASDQLLFAISGAMEVSALHKLWLIPPQFAVWIPAGTTHRIRMSGAVSMRTLYLRRGLTNMPATCAVLYVAPLLRELIVEAVRLKQLRASDPLHRTLRDLIVNQIEHAAPIPIVVAMPADKRALTVAQAVMADHAGCPPLPSLCRSAGVSVRTVERVFQREVGLTFELWRRQARLMKAIELLAGGASVKGVTFEVGYQRASAFVEMFRKTMGATPKAWATRLRQLEAKTIHQ